MFDTSKEAQGSRFEQVMKWLGLNQPAFAKAFGQRQSNLSLMVNGKRPVPPALILEISKRYEDFNPQWLLTGEGEMLRGETGAAAGVEHHFPDAGKMVVEEPAVGYGGGVLERMQREIDELRARVAALEARESKQP